MKKLLGEIEGGQGLTMESASVLFPGNGENGKVAPFTVFRWTTRGIKTQNGTVAKLEAVKVGGRTLTSRPAVVRFLKALSANKPN